MANKFSIIGISGTNGSGKDTVGELLAQSFGYTFISVTDALRAECARRGWSTDREFTRRISTEWRREFGLAVLVDRAIQTYKAASGNATGVAMASLRNPFEAERIHQLGGVMIWVDADPKIRYQRVVGAARGRGDEDNKTFEQFIKDDSAEMHPPKGAGDSALNMAQVKAKSDFIVINNSTRQALQKNLSEILEQNK